MTTLITGATGQLGHRIVSALLDRLEAARIAISTRHPDAAADLARRGVDVRYGDFDDQDSLRTAFAGVDRLLIISTDGDNATRIRQHATAVEAAHREEVGLIAYTSIVHADTSPIPLAEVHRATEDAINATGIPHVFLRNNWYLENEFGTVQGVLAGAPVVNPIGDARIGWVTRDDLAVATANILATGDPDEIYELAGPPRTYRDLAAALAEVLDRDVPVQDVDDDTYTKILVDAGLPEPVAQGIAAMQPAIRNGGLDTQDSDLQHALGRPATPLRDAVAAMVADAKDT